MNREIHRFCRRLRLGRPIESGDVGIVTTRIRDRQVCFCINMTNDPIQRNHSKGAFYEMPELEELAAHFPKGGTFVDIGANVGNHSLFAAMFMEAGLVIPFEPNPLAYRLLLQNMVVNGQADKVDFSMLGCGLSDVEAGGLAMQKKTRNLGSAKMLKSGGDLQVFRADTLLEGVTPDMIKIDVQGMEMAVLRGLSGVLNRCRPVIQIEVDNENDADFKLWAAEAGYAVMTTVKRYKRNQNYLLCDAAALQASDKNGAPAQSNTANPPAVGPVGKTARKSRKTRVKID